MLLLADGAFAEASAATTELVDNPAMLQLDLVWADFRLLQQHQGGGGGGGGAGGGALADAEARLGRAREQLRRAHGPAGERLRVLHGGFRPELATYVRLELLEGVARYHRGDWDGARGKLLEARNKYGLLQVSGEAAGALEGMGFTRKEAERALRFCGGTDVAAAAEAAAGWRAQEAERREAEERRRGRRREQQRLGRTRGVRGGGAPQPLPTFPSRSRELRVLLSAVLAQQQ